MEQVSDVLENPSAYATVISKAITVRKTGVSKLNVMQQIRKQVLTFPHAVQFETKFLEQVAVEVFNRK